MTVVIIISIAALAIVFALKAYCNWVNGIIDNDDFYEPNYD